MSNYVLESKLKIFNDLGEFLVDESAPLPPPPLCLPSSPSREMMNHVLVPPQF